MNTTINEHGLSHQQLRFCDEYLVNFNAYQSAITAGYSENTARKGELLHAPKVQTYLKLKMQRTSERLEITHDMVLRELAKIAFANMGNYYDENAVLRPINQLTDDERAAVSHYQIVDIIGSYREKIGEISKIKLHNKLSALDKIARHLNFYGFASEKPKAESLKQEVGVSPDFWGEVAVAGAVAVEEDQLVMAGGMEPGVVGNPDNRWDTSEEPLDEFTAGGSEPGVVVGHERDARASAKEDSGDVSDVNGERVENILTLSPLLKQCLKDRMIKKLNKDREPEFAVG